MKLILVVPITLLMIVAHSVLDSDKACSQTFSVPWYTIDGGGGDSSTAGEFQLNGTIGQPDASHSITGGTFTLNGGFWTTFQEETILGDVNGDGEINLLDVAPFVEAISTGEFIPEADINGDGMVNLLDVAPFVALLSGG